MLPHLRDRSWISPQASSSIPAQSALFPAPAPSFQSPFICIPPEPDPSMKLVQIPSSFSIRSDSLYSHTPHSSPQPGQDHCSRQKRSCSLLWLEAISSQMICTTDRFQSPHASANVKRTPETLERVIPPTRPLESGGKRHSFSGPSSNYCRYCSLGGC